MTTEYNNVVAFRAMLGTDASNCVEIGASVKNVAEELKNKQSLNASRLIVINNNVDQWIYNLTHNLPPPSWTMEPDPL